MKLADKANLGQLVNYAIINKLHISKNNRSVIIGNFDFHCWQLSDRYKVKVYIVGAGSPYQIVENTFMMGNSYNNYPSEFKKGAWDTAFLRAKKTLRESVKKHIQEYEENKRREEEEEKRREEEHRKRVERMFL